jgi:hypothetical protein
MGKHSMNRSRTIHFDTLSSFLKRFFVCEWDIDFFFRKNTAMWFFFPSNCLIRSRRAQTPLIVVNKKHMSISTLEHGSLQSVFAFLSSGDLDTTHGVCRQWRAMRETVLQARWAHSQLVVHHFKRLVEDIDSDHPLVCGPALVDFLCTFLKAFTTKSITKCVLHCPRFVERLALLARKVPVDNDVFHNAVVALCKLAYLDDRVLEIVRRESGSLSYFIDLLTTDNPKPKYKPSTRLVLLEIVYVMGFNVAMTCDPIVNMLAAMHNRGDTQELAYEMLVTLTGIWTALLPGDYQKVAPLALQCIDHNQENASAIARQLCRMMAQQDVKQRSFAFIDLYLSQENAARLVQVAARASNEVAVDIMEELMFLFVNHSTDTHRDHLLHSGMASSVLRLLRGTKHHSEFLCARELVPHLLRLPDERTTLIRGGLFSILITLIRRVHHTSRDAEPFVHIMMDQLVACDEPERIIWEAAGGWSMLLTYLENPRFMEVRGKVLSSLTELVHSDDPAVAAFLHRADLLIALRTRYSTREQRQNARALHELILTCGAHDAQNE